MERLSDKVGFWLVLGVLVVFPLGQLSRITLPWQEARLYLSDFLVGGIWLVLGYKVLTGEKVVWPKFKKLVCAFGLVGMLSLVVNLWRFAPGEVLLGSLYLWRWLAYAGIYFFVRQLPRSRLLRIEEYLIFAGVTAAVLGLVQYFIFPDAWPLVADQWDPHVSRVMGTYLDPNFAGLIYVFAMLLLFGKIWQGNKNKRSFAISYLLLAICYSAFILTYSRSTYVAFLVGLAVFSLVKKAPRFFLAILFFFIVSIYFLPRPHGEGTRLGRQSTVSARWQSWQQAWEVIRERPLFGVGFDLYRYEQRNRGFLGEKWQVSHAGAGVDNSLLFVWVTTGIFGLTTYLWLLARTFTFSWKWCFNPLGLTLLSSLLAALTHALFNNSLFYLWIMIWLWMLLGTIESLQA